MGCVAGALSVLSAILSGCGDTCQSDVQAALARVEDNCDALNQTLIVGVLDCRCTVQTEKLQKFSEKASSCSANTDWYPDAQDQQRRLTESTCCDYYSNYINQELVKTTAEYDAGPTNPPRYCQYYEACWDTVQGETNRCQDSTLRAGAELEIRNKLDNGNCQVEKVVV